jgi:hypothetical protein
VPTSGRGARRVAVLITQRVWRAEVERFDSRSPARLAAERERPRLESNGLALADLRRCEAEAADGTRLVGLVKVYVPIGDAPPSERPYAFVLSPAHGEPIPALALVAFGERHPRRGVRSVYERAHKRLHGRYPDQ